MPNLPLNYDMHELLQNKPVNQLNKKLIMLRSIKCQSYMPLNLVCDYFFDYMYKLTRFYVKG